MENAWAIARRRIKRKIKRDIGIDGYVYFDAFQQKIISLCLWKLYRDTNILHILLISSDTFEEIMMNDIEYYCFENNIPTISVTPATRSLFDYYEALGFVVDPSNTSLMIKPLSLPQIHIRKKNRTRRVCAKKHTYPIVASMMPIENTTWKTDDF